MIAVCVKGTRGAMGGMDAMGAKVSVVAIGVVVTMGAISVKGAVGAIFPSVCNKVILEYTYFTLE